MAVDISKIFKANVKAIRTGTGDDGNKENEALNEDLLGKGKSAKTKSKSAAMSPETQSIAKEARSIIVSITTLRDFLNENKKAYLQPDYLFSRSNDEFSDSDLQKFENQAESIIKRCSEAIRTLKSKTTSQMPTFASQYNQHLENMFYLMDKYLKDVLKMYADQKAVRVQRAKEHQNYLQLSVPAIEKSKTPAYNPDLEMEIEKTQKFDPIINELTPQELQELEKENEQLFDDLTIQSEEIKQIESKVIEVSRLAQVISENIVSQANVVDQIQKSTIETTSNLTLGNTSIKEAMKKGAALRLWIVFIMVVLSFTLLFLDWYND